MEPDPAQVYSPAEDSEFLCVTARREVLADDRVLEIGTGSGIIAATLQDNVHCLIATDINPHAVALTRARGVPVVRADLTAGFRGPFDVILFNPPYLPTAPEERIADWLEYALDGGKSGRAVIFRFLSDAHRILGPQGRILLLVSSITGLCEVLGMAKDYGYVAEVIGEQDVEDEILYVLRLKHPV